MSSPIIGRQCRTCRNATNYLFVNKVKACRAYPQGIPAEILLDEHDHSKPFAGDNGILYEPIKEKSSR